MLTRSLGALFSEYGSISGTESSITITGGSYSLSTSAEQALDYSGGGTLTFNYADATTTASAFGNSSLDLHAEAHTSGSDSGSFDADGDSGTYKLSTTGSGTADFLAEIDGQYHYAEDGDTAHGTWWIEESAGGASSLSAKETSSYTPTESEGLYSSSFTAGGTYSFGSGFNDNTVEIGASHSLLLS
jgi:hypothetical protein